MARRIKRPKEQEPVYKQLTDSDEFGFFTTYKDIFMLAGTIGFMSNKRVEFSGSAEGIPWNVFNLDSDESVINAVAIAETEDPNILKSGDETFDKKLQIFEEYAAGGIEIFKDKIMSEKKHAFENYFAFVMDMENQASVKDRNLKNIAEMINF
jgi:dnd system-associated protein 4